MKILCLYDPSSGSKFHRVWLQMLPFQPDFVSELSKEVCSKYDLIYIHYNCNVFAAELALWKKEFGFKIVWDTDDTWDIPKNHLMYKELKQGEQNSKDLCILADWVTCSTEEIRKDLLDYNDNVTVIPNFIPYGENQFKVTEETFEEFEKRPIRIGLIGSNSHLDDWASLKGWINRILTIKTENKFEFVICGINLKWPGVKIIPGKPPQEYMEVYKGVDILLCPLLNTKQNKCRSDLKIKEAACNNTICLLDELYKEKGIYHNWHIVIKKESEWFSRVKELLSLSKEELWKNKLHSGEGVRGYSNKNDIIDLRAGVLETAMEFKEKPKLESIYSLKYKDDQIVEWQFYYNKRKTLEEKTWRFEANAVLDLFGGGQSDQFGNQYHNENYGNYCGVLSHKFPQKTLFFKKKVDWILKKETSDVITFCPKLPEPYLQFTEKQHFGFKECFYEICTHLGLPTKEPRHVIYSSFVLARPEIYKEYINDVLKPALEYMESRPYSNFFKDARYKSGLSTADLLKHTGMHYYPMVVFILERLWSQFLETKNYKVKNYVY